MPLFPRWLELAFQLGLYWECRKPHRCRDAGGTAEMKQTLWTEGEGRPRVWNRKGDEHPFGDINYFTSDL